MGSTRCGVTSGTLSIIETTGAFGLMERSSIYRLIGRDEADAVAAHILHADLAYGSQIMEIAHAAHLWRQFVALVDGEGEAVRFATNAAKGLSSWTPATDATFDMGVLMIGTTKAGCLRVEDED